MELSITVVVILAMIPLMALLSLALMQLAFRRARAGMQRALTAEEQELFCSPAWFMMGRLFPASGAVMVTSARLLWASPTWMPWWHKIRSVGLDELEDIRSEKSAVTMRIEGRHKYIMPMNLWFGIPIMRSHQKERLASALAERTRT
jgi:hypothetical protein